MIRFGRFRNSDIRLWSIFGMLFCLFLASTAAMAQTFDEPSDSYLNFALSSERQLRCGYLEKEDCTATLVKIENRCVLLTNSHCMVSEQGSFVVDSGSTFTTHVLKRDEILDLVQLDLPKEIESRYCEGIRSTGAKGKDFDVGFFRSVGFRNQIKNDYRTGGDGFSSGTARIYSLSKDVNDILLRLDHIDVFPGMSGGVVELAGGDFVGIVAHYIPFQSTALVIPPIAIAKFLNSKEAVRSLPGAVRNSVPNSWVKTGSNTIRPSGGNSQGDPGGNSQGDPGGNSQGDPANGLSRGIVDPLKIAVEPNEGYPLENASNTLILGVSGKQVDGYDDYLKEYRGQAGRTDLVTRPNSEDQYPDSSIRREVLSRLAGVYSAAHESDSDGVEYLYMKDPSAPMGWKKFAGTLYSHPELVVDAKKKQITLTLDQRQLDMANAGQPMEMKAITMRFHASMSNDDKWVTLTPEPDSQAPIIQARSPFQCKNQNYLKLICANENGFFSLSKANDKNGKLNFRYGMKFKIGEREFFLYDFEELKTIGSADRFRKGEK
jgi:hypothetical protein